MDLYFTGTDVLFLKEYPKGIGWRMKLRIFAFRILVKILDSHFTERNFVVDNYLKKWLDLKRPVYELYPNIELVKYKKQEHRGFNILYYFPKKKNNHEFHKWVYGWDVFKKLKDYFGDKITWIVANGDSDISKFYPYIDFYLRPNRHDGMPYMIKECVENDIPYYWSRSNPDIEEIKSKIAQVINDKGYSKALKTDWRRGIFPSYKGKI